MRKIKKVNPEGKKKGRKRWDAILSRLPKDRPLIGAEIGVWQGKTSCRLLAERKDLVLYMIDPWIPPNKNSSYFKTGDDNARKTKEQHNKDYRRTMQKVKFAGNRAKIMRMTSQQAAERIEDKSLDFVFIDSDHSYEGVKLDTILWLPKIKIGGFIVYHDYNHPRLPGVKKAIDELFNRKEMEFDANRTVFIRI